MAWPARQNEVHGNIKGRWETVDALQISEREGWRAKKNDSVTEKIPSSKLRKKKIPEGLHQTSPPPYPYPHCLYARVLNTCLCWLNNARADKVLHEIFHWYYPTLPSCYLSWYFVGYGLSFNFMLWIHVISNPSPRGYQQLVSETLGLQFFIWN